MQHHHLGRAAKGERNFTEKKRKIPLTLMRAAENLKMECL